MEKPPNETSKLSEEQKFVLEEVFQEGWRDGTWPQYAVLDRRFYAKNVDLDRDLFPLIPHFMRRTGIGPSLQADETLRLTVRGANEVSGRDSVIPIFLQVLRYLIEYEEDYVPTPMSMQPSISSKEVGHFLTGIRSSYDAERIALRLGLLFLEEPAIWSGMTSMPGEMWTMTISNQIRRYKGVTGIEDYLNRSPLTDRPMVKTLPVASVSQQETVNREIDIDSRHVFIVHGRDGEAHGAVSDFVRALDLWPIEWSEAVTATGTTSPYTGQVVAQAFKMAKAVIILFTPDDIAHLHSELLNEKDPDWESVPTSQARPNVLIEAGMALAIQRDRTVIVEIGTTRSISDIAGLNTVRITDAQSLNSLAQRLQDAGCPVKRGGSDWLSTSRFESLRAIQRSPSTAAAFNSNLGNTNAVGAENEKGRDDAVLISAWAEIEKTIEANGAESFGVIATAQNGSVQPIYDVRIRWFVGGKFFAEDFAGVIPPNSQYRWRFDKETFLNTLKVDQHRLATAENALSVVKRSRIAISFSDSEKRRWSREADGLLSQSNA